MWVLGALLVLLQVTYRALLDEFFKRHDPTSLNKQGADVGTQYRGELNQPQQTPFRPPCFWTAAPAFTYGH